MRFIFILQLACPAGEAGFRTVVNAKRLCRTLGPGRGEGGGSCFRSSMERQDHGSEMTVNYLLVDSDR